MELTAVDQAALNVALNEATLLGLEFEPAGRRAGLTLSLLTLPAGDGPMETDRRVQFIMGDITRFAVSLREGPWNDASASVTPVTPQDLLALSKSFEWREIYGWEFFGAADSSISTWGTRLSLDWRSAPDSTHRHTFAAFQESRDRHLDFAIWFGSLECRTPGGERLTIAEICEAGKRFWDAVHAGDPRTLDAGIVRGRPPTA